MILQRYYNIVSNINHEINNMEEYTNIEYVYYICNNNNSLFRHLNTTVEKIL